MNAVSPRNYRKYPGRDQARVFVVSGSDLDDEGVPALFRVQKAHRSGRWADPWGLLLNVVRNTHATGAKYFAP